MQKPARITKETKPSTKGDLNQWHKNHTHMTDYQKRYAQHAGNGLKETYWKENRTLAHATNAIEGRNLVTQ
jgi:hypothetical protein